MTAAVAERQRGIAGAISDLFFVRPQLLTFLLLMPPLLWIGGV